MESIVCLVFLVAPHSVVSCLFDPDPLTQAREISREERTERVESRARRQKKGQQYEVGVRLECDEKKEKEKEKKKKTTKEERMR